uniref:Carboxy-cis,cis-muconate cyclase n=1 Tax=Colletotrichum fructicola (strain Nara gc5) TaxID=1213859 RepID=L2G9K4_COLFN
MTIHHLMIGTWTPPGAIFTVAFDDEKFTLELVKRTEIPQEQPISWMTFSHDKKNLYGAAMKKWSSFAVKSPSEIIHEASHDMTHDPNAALSTTNTRAFFLLAAQKPPYAVYCNPFYKHASHGNIFSVSPTGKLETNVQNYPYDPNTGIHGMVFDPTETYLYSADLTANKLWAGNRLCEYVIDPATKLPVYTHRSFPLIPPGIPGANSKMYRSDVCTLSHSGKYLFATARSNSFDVTGYIAAFKLDDNGHIERQICLNPTPTSGGHSNAEGWIEIYRWHDEFLGRVARLRIPEPGFGMNAIWYD